MKKPNKKVVIITSVLVCIIGLVLFVAVLVLNNNGAQRFPDGTVVRKNVSIITAETEQEKLPIAVNDDQLVFAVNPNYPKGEIVVAGILDTAPYGFIRKVIETVKEGDSYVVKTEPGVLTDVFEEAHIVERFVLTDKNTADIDRTSAGNATATPLSATILNYSADRNSVQILNTVSQGDDSFLFEKQFKQELANGISLDGTVGVGAWLEVKIDITPITKQESSVDFGITVHSAVEGDISVGYRTEAMLELEKELFSKQFAHSFFIGPVPVVITNEVNASLEGQAGIDGSIGLNYELSAESATGFLYSSKTNQVEEIHEKTFQSDGLTWNTKAEAEGQAAIGVYIHLISKLYDSTGIDLSAGVVGSIEGQVAASLVPSADGLHYAGSLDLAIGPEIEGKLIVSIPIIDTRLIEQRLFTVKLPPWWERHWPQDDEEASDDKPTIGGVESGRTYTTKFEKSANFTFQFDYPSGWEMITEQVSSQSEIVELTNGEGITIRYQYIVPAYAYGGMRISMGTETLKVADSKFVPNSTYTPNHQDLGEFVVAKIKTTSSQNLRTDPEPTQSDSDYFSYAVMPESACGSHTRDGNFVNAFQYDGLLQLMAEAPRKLTEKEEKEVIAILASFREADSEALPVLANQDTADNPDIDTTAEWYRTYGKLISQLPARANTNGLGLAESMNGDVERGEGGGAAVANVTEGALFLYSFSDIGKDDVPELFIGAQSDGTITILLIYSFADHWANAIYSQSAYENYGFDMDTYIEFPAGLERPTGFPSIKDIDVNQLEWKRPSD